MAAKKKASRKKAAKRRFDPEGAGYDYDSARTAGMKPHGGKGPNAGHWGSVAELTPGTHLILKGRKHQTWDKMEAAEKKRGAKIEKSGGRYYSVLPSRKKKAARKRK